MNTFLLVYISAFVLLLVHLFITRNDNLLYTFLGGPADLAGLRVGDKVISVNGVSVVNVDHYDAVEVLKACGRVLVLVIIREVTRIIPQYEQVRDSFSIISPSFNSNITR